MLGSTERFQGSEAALSDPKLCSLPSPSNSLLDSCPCVCVRAWVWVWVCGLQGFPAAPDLNLQVTGIANQSLPICLGRAGEGQAQELMPHPSPGPRGPAGLGRGGGPGAGAAVARRGAAASPSPGRRVARGCSQDPERILGGECPRPRLRAVGGGAGKERAPSHSPPPRPRRHPRSWRTGKRLRGPAPQSTACSAAAPPCPASTPPR